VTKDFNTKKEFIRELADRAQFSMKDIEIIYDALEEMIKDKIRNLENISLSGLMIIKPKLIKSHKGWDGIKKQEINLPDAYRITISPSSSLVDELRNKLASHKEE
jgi:nucleoid DNA-binding protein